MIVLPIDLRISELSLLVKVSGTRTRIAVLLIDTTGADISLMVTLLNFGFVLKLIPVTVMVSFIFPERGATERMVGTKYRKLPTAVAVFLVKVTDKGTE